MVSAGSLFLYSLSMARAASVVRRIFRVGETGSAIAESIGEGCVLLRQRAAGSL